MTDSMKPCPVCGKQPKLRTCFAENPTGGWLFGARYHCAPWWGLGIWFHKVTSIKWNVKSWGDLAIRRAREEWEGERYV